MKKIIGVGVDLGGTFIKYALGSDDGRIFLEKKCQTDSQSNKTRILNQISEVVKDMIAEGRARKLKPTVVGIGTPGSVDIRNGYLMGSTPNFRNWKNVNISDVISERSSLPVFVDNDANLMAFAESKFGAGKNHQHIICLTIGTGIGGGIIINGELFRGSRYAGAELGHMSIKVDGVKCRCGGRGCLESYASASAMIKYFQKKSNASGKFVAEKDLSVKYIFELYKKADRVAVDTIEESTYYLGRGIANLINIFNPSIIIIGGGVAESGNDYINVLKKVAFQYSMENARRRVRIVGARLGNKAGCLGAIAFAAEQLQKRSKRKK